MRMKTVLTVLLMLLGIHSEAQNIESSSVSIAINSFIEGTLLVPNDDTPKPLVIIIADTGPTDRDGNQNFQKHNALKKLAEGLATHNIASFRYDKRIVKQIRHRSIDPKLSFDDFVNDAKSVVDKFATNTAFSKIYILGHGQGSLVGMLAVQSNVDGFISVAGSGKPIDQVILDQVALMDPSLVEPTTLAFSELKQGKLTKNYPQALESIFNLQTQPFMRSWMQYDPQIVIKSITIPTLIISGTKDLQVPVSEAELLKVNASNAKLQLIKDMNHVLFHIEGNELENSKSYNESFRSIANELINAIVAFINN